MTPTLSARLTLIALALAGGIGILDSVIDKAWDHVALFTVVLVLSIGLLARLAVGRQVVRLRPDEIHWLARRARLTGESLDDVADRAVSTYRSALSAETTEPVQPGAPAETPAPDEG